MGFNTQPPEGGWKLSNLSTTAQYGFNTQPPEGGWSRAISLRGAGSVSTHSRLKAAGRAWQAKIMEDVFQHTAA